MIALVQVTCSWKAAAVALAQFEDNEVPNIRTVNRWPGQEEGWGAYLLPWVAI